MRGWEFSVDFERFGSVVFVLRCLMASAQVMRKQEHLEAGKRRV